PSQECAFAITSQECVLAGTSQDCVLAGTSQDGVLHFAPMTMTATIMRSAAIMDVDIGAFPPTVMRTQVHPSDKLRTPKVQKYECNSTGTDILLGCSACRLYTGIFVQTENILVRKTVTWSSTARPGACPRMNGPGLCGEFCSNDNNCSINEKCCHNGCGHQCIALHSDVRPPEHPCEKAGNMEQHGSVWALVLALSALVHFDIVFASSQECALSRTAQEGVVNIAPMTMTAPIMRSAAIMDVDISALPCTVMCTQARGPSILLGCSACRLYTGIFVQTENILVRKPSSQECALSRTAQDRVVNIAPMTLTAPIMRSAAIMDVEISAFPRTVMCTQPGQECALLGTSQDRVLHYAPMTLTATMRRSAALMDVDMSALPTILPKPGHCPRLLNVIPSHKGCECDEDCPADNKCCVFDCGAVCVPPAFTKPGVCPRRNWGSGMCAEYCSNDNDCPNDEKCCHNGCGHECIAPYTVKRGRCALPQGTSMCAEYCYHDGQCPGEQKCCKTTCGHACSEPC
ncbi:hypothetical protein JOQ06_007021, partial [Pogonophryne albipinna]